ncbi:MAG: hypothetical protein ACJAUH_000651 [Saprospiraceae bacterium]|jgi:hypothetical protein
MGLSRTELEKQLAELLLEKATKLGYKLTVEKYKGHSHVIRYTRKQGEINQELQIRFVISHYLWTDAALWITYDSIGSLIKEFSTEEYLAHIAVRFSEHENKVYINKHKNYSLFNKSDIKEIAEWIYQKYFLAVENITPQVNTISKVEEIINSEEHLFKEPIDMIPLTNWVFPVQMHVLVGVTLALLCGNKNYKKIIERYIRYIDFDFQKDEAEIIELVYKIIEKYEPELMKLSIRSRD